MKTAKDVSKAPRCPLCYAMFDRRLDEMVKQRLEVMFAEAIVQLKTSTNDKELAKNKRWCEVLDESIKGGAAEVFVCHYCKIGIACNDPFVGRWEEAYAKGEKILCAACDHEMRFFCTSTGFMLAQCPVKACRSRMQISTPDRNAVDPSKARLYGSDGKELLLPNIDRATSTPDDMSDAQLGGSGKAEGLPDVTTINLPPDRGNA